MKGTEYLPWAANSQSRNAKLSDSGFLYWTKEPRKEEKGIASINGNSTVSVLAGQARIQTLTVSGTYPDVLTS